MAFDVLPEPLDRIEIGAIGRQIKWFDVMPMQTFCRVPAGVVEHENNFKSVASRRLRAFSLAHVYLATTNSGSVQESRSGAMRGREMSHIEAIQTFVQFLLSHFGNYFWQTVYLKNKSHLPYLQTISDSFGSALNPSLNAIRSRLQITYTP